MKIIYLIIAILLVSIVSNIVYTIISTILNSTVIFYGSIILALILAYTGIKEDLKKN